MIFLFLARPNKNSSILLLCKHINYFDWNKNGISCIETRRRLIFQPCCIYFTPFFFVVSGELLEEVKKKSEKKREKMRFQLSIFYFFFVRCLVHIEQYLRASLAEATPNDNPFVFHSLSSLRSMFCVFDFAFLMLFSLAPFSLSRENFFLHHRPGKRKKSVIHID